MFLYYQAVELSAQIEHLDTLFVPISTVRVSKSSYISQVTMIV